MLPCGSAAERATVRSRKFKRRWEADGSPPCHPGGSRRSPRVAPSWPDLGVRVCRCLAQPGLKREPTAPRLICSNAGRGVFSGPARVFRHVQVVEHAPGMAVEAAHGGGDAIVSGLDQADGEATQPGGVGRGRVRCGCAAAVLVEGVVEDVVNGLDLPVAAVELEQSAGVRRCREDGW